MPPTAANVVASVWRASCAALHPLYFCARSDKTCMPHYICMFVNLPRKNKDCKTGDCCRYSTRSATLSLQTITCPLNCAESSVKHPTATTRGAPPGGHRRSSPGIRLPPRAHLHSMHLRRFAQPVCFCSHLPPREPRGLRPTWQTQPLRRASILGCKPSIGRVALVASLARLSVHTCWLPYCECYRQVVVERLLHQVLAQMARNGMP
mmetsp:Transcript_40306/g.92692  ORF Transcript_40306/g.92692 Transcript_40306/m.92692 type:complete len:207 (-) Transcript_40306:94-714(-)